MELATSFGRDNPQSAIVNPQSKVLGFGFFDAVDLDCRPVLVHLAFYNDFLSCQLLCYILLVQGVDLAARGEDSSRALADAALGAARVTGILSLLGCTVRIGDISGPLARIDAYSGQKEYQQTQNSCFLHTTPPLITLGCG